MNFAEEPLEAAREVIANSIHRVADGGISLPWVAAMVASTGDEDHVEIGTLFGASAITAALTKKKLGFKGDVYCIDPFVHRDTVMYRDNIPPDEREGSVEKVLENAAHFGVELKIIRAYSHPWPAELADKTFGSAYIDGDHTIDGPWHDFLNLRFRVTQCIGFDNYEEAYPRVIQAVHSAIIHDTGWMFWFMNDRFCALRRRGTAEPRMKSTSVYTT